MVGSSIVRQLARRGYTSLLTPTSGDLDLTDQHHVRRFFRSASPDAVILAAAKVGGILANSSYPADFLYRNLIIETNVIDAAREFNVAKLVFLASSCAYPRDAVQPMREEALLSGPLEPTNEPYAIAKIVGVKMCESYFRQYGSNFLSLMPTNLYGPNDNFDPQTSHVIPALIRKFHEAKEQDADTVRIWGSGTPRREFMHVDDLAEAVVFVLENVEAESVFRHGISHLNVGTGSDLTILETAELIKDVVRYKGEIDLDGSKPDGALQKLLDVRRMHELGWRHRIELREGLERTYDWFLNNVGARNETIGAKRSVTDGR